jgi:hypothetical protein
VSARQAVLVIVTERDSIRAEAVGWGHEDGRNVVPGKPIGFTPAGHGTLPDCPLRALGDGWRLLAPPVASGAEWEWWFVRDEEVGS